MAHIVWAIYYGPYNIYGYLGQFRSSGGHFWTFQGYLRSALAVNYAYCPPRRLHYRLNLTIDIITRVYSPKWNEERLIFEQLYVPLIHMDHMIWCLCRIEPYNLDDSLLRFRAFSFLEV